MTEEQMEVVRLHMRDTYDVAPWEWDSGELELAIYELITKNQGKNNESIDLVSKCCDEHIEERDLYVDPSDGRMFCNQCGKTLNAEIMKMKRGKVKFNVC